MHLNTKENPVLRNFLGKVVNQNDKKEYTVKIVVYEKPLAETPSFGDIHSISVVEAPNGEIVSRALYPSKLTKLEIDANSKNIMDNIETIISESEYGKDTTNN